jgi:hypothetical protein
VVAAPAAPTAAEALDGCCAPDEFDCEGFGEVFEVFVFTVDPSLVDFPCAGGCSGVEELYRWGCRTRRSGVRGTNNRGRVANEMWEPIPF